MDAQDYPIRHFEQMTQLSSLFRDLPAQVQDHQYSYESFGSWNVVVRYKGIRVRVMFDGKESSYSVERSDSREAPDQWRKPHWQHSSTSESLPLAAIIAAVVDSATVG